jgi:DNA ligase D-like protein (predicted ligase)
MAMDETLFARLDADERNKLTSRGQPEWMAPMLATLVDEPFSNDDWLFERKFDGIRGLAWCRDGQPTLLSRNRQRLDDTYPELVDALAAQATGDIIVDGEIVAFRGNQTSFSRLQQRSGIHDAEAARASGVAVYYYLFDLLYAGGCQLTALPLRTRKRLLKEVVGFTDPLRLTPHRNGAGEAIYREACNRGWEGVIAKQAASAYVGKRSRQWLKFKCVCQSEFVIGGYTDPAGARTGFGALLLGYYADGDLRYAGRVGTGFDNHLLDELGGELAAMEQRRPVFADSDIARSGVHWVQPKLVAEVGFTEWTDDNRLRHPRFLGLRDDKPARKVRREGAS